MDTSMNDRLLLDEEIWQAWIQKSKLREEATARKLKRLAQIALLLLAVGVVFYLLVVLLSSPRCSLERLRSLSPKDNPSREQTSGAGT